MASRALLFSILIGALLIIGGSALAMASLANWSLASVGLLLVAIAMLQALDHYRARQPRLVPLPVFRSQRVEH